MTVAAPIHPASFYSRPPSRSRRNTSVSSSTSILQQLEPDSRDMAEHHPPLDLRTRSAPDPSQQHAADNPTLQPVASHEAVPDSVSGESTISNGFTPSTPPTPGRLSRTGSFSDLEEDTAPVERLTVFDLLENLALPQRLEKLQNSIASRTEKVLRSQGRIKTSSLSAKDKVVEEWRRRVPTADEQLDRYRKRMRHSVDRLSSRWNDQKTVTMREKVSFIAAVLNIFITGYLIGGHPEWMHYWYTAQVFYFLPIRAYTYKKKGYHYFLADLCYFVNMLTLLSIYVFPRSKRLFISTYCLAFGNNAIAIAMWRNSLVFHSMDKVVSLFIHIMPCVTLHCLVHLVDPEHQAKRYPAIHAILNSPSTSPEHYSLLQMMFWASWPYAVWQLSYHFLISVRRRDKIAAGRPTSFTWLRRSFAKVWIGKFVLSLPEPLQEPAYMGIQYVYALGTMIPCPLWFWSGWASGIFLSAVFAWSVWNGATYYIDIFGNRFQKELEALKKDVAKWQSTPELVKTPLSPTAEGIAIGEGKLTALKPLPGDADKVERGKDAVPGLLGGIGPDDLLAAKKDS